MFREPKYRKRNRMSYTPAVVAALLTLLTAHAADAFPVDFILNSPGDRKQAEPQAQDAQEAPVEAKEADDSQPVAAEANPVKRGIVREKAAVVAEGAAEAAEEVGQVLGELISGLFGRGRGNPAVVGDVNLNGNALNQFEAQYGRHFDQVVKTELHFIRLVCQLTREQYDAMASDGKLIRTKTINKFALLQQGMNRGIQSSSDHDTRKPIADGLLESAKRHLKPDQVAKYESELAERNNAKKEVSVLTTAAKVDRKLVLNTEQRAQVSKILSENWNEPWGSTQMMMYGGDHFPNVPDRELTPILTATQKKVWRTVTQQNQVFFGFNIGMNQGIAIADEQWDDDKPADDKVANDKVASDKPANEAKTDTEPANAKPVRKLRDANPKTVPVDENEKPEASE
jgi:hypothetical protein